MSDVRVESNPLPELRIDPAAVTMLPFSPFSSASPSAPPQSEVKKGVQSEVKKESPAETDPIETEPAPNKRSSKHAVYAVEILIFALLGWGWLAVREYMGNTPVMDVTALLCLIISAILNLALALVYYTTDQFKTLAQGFFAHTLSIWVFYAYSLVESITTRSGPLCCGTSDFAVHKTYATAFFGGLPLHQTVGAVTVAFLTVLLLLAAGQVRACLTDPREWLTGRFPLSVACLVSVHLGMFVSKAGVCGDGGMSSGVLVLAGVVCLLIVDILDLTGWQKSEMNLLIQMLCGLFPALILAAVAAVLSSKLGGGVSTPLLLLLGGVALWLAVPPGIILVGHAVGWMRPAKKVEEDDTPPSAPPAEAVGVSSRFHRRPVLVQWQGARPRGGKKAW